MIKISICGGGNCDMNGSGETMAAFIKAVDDAGLYSDVVLTKAFCMGECNNGPCVRIDGVKFRHVHPEDVAVLMETEVVPKVKANQ